MTQYQYYERFCQVWNRKCKDKLVHNEEEYRIAESFLNEIADICHMKDIRNTKSESFNWDVCSRLFTDFIREVRLKFGVDLTEKYRKEANDANA